jgi:hypothetical protein
MDELRSQAHNSTIVEQLRGLQGHRISEFSATSTHNAYPEHYLKNTVGCLCLAVVIVANIIWGITRWSVGLSFALWLSMFFVECVTWIVKASLEKRELLFCNGAIIVRDPVAREIKSVFTRKEGPWHIELQPAKRIFRLKNERDWGTISVGKMSTSMVKLGGYDDSHTIFDKIMGILNPPDTGVISIKIEQ